MRIKSKEFRVDPAAEIKLADRATSIDPICSDKQGYKKRLKKHVKRMSALQRLHYASNHHALLLIFQGMDAAGEGWRYPSRQG